LDPPGELGEIEQSGGHLGPSPNNPVGSLKEIGLLKA